MASVIRAGDRDRGIQGVAFNFDDVAVKAGEYLAKVRAEASEILDQARREAAAIRDKAEKESRNAGYQAGRQAGAKELEKMVDDRLAAQLATLRPALNKVVQEIQQAKQAWLAHWERAGIHVAAAIAARIMRRQVEQMPEVALILMRETLELAAGGAPLRIRLHPADYEALKPRVAALVHDLAPLGEAEVIADPAITSGGCRVDTAFGVVDSTIEAQLARIEEELT